MHPSGRAEPATASAVQRYNSAMQRPPEQGRRGRGVLTALLLASVALAACSEGSDEPAAAPTPEKSSASDPAPVVLSQTGGWFWRFSVAPDGRTALYGWSTGFFPQTRDSSIYETERQPDGTWGEGTEVPFVDGTTSDIDPVHSADGSRVWFSSIRPVSGTAKKDVDVWQVDRRPDGTWGAPVHVPAVSSPGDDLYPSVAPDGSIFIGSDRSGSGFDIWRAEARGEGWLPAQPLPEPVSSSLWEFNPAVSPDGSVLVFTARGRDGGEGEGDLFSARRVGGGWTAPVPVLATNTAADEYHPSFSPDGGTLYFVRRGDVFSVPWPG